MSVCDPKSPDACEKCRPGAQVLDLPRLPRGEDQIKELEKLLAEMKAIRLEARRLTRSGHPGVRAEGLAALAKAEDNIRWIHHELAEEQ